MFGHNKHILQKAESGFALLITIIVLTVVVSVTLAIVELSLKQLQLSVDSKDSEIAFQAANAGLECARFTRKDKSSEFEDPLDDSISSDCLGGNSNAAPFTVLDIQEANTIKTPSGSFESIPRTPATGDGFEKFVSYQMEWGTPGRCSEINMMVMNVDPTSGSGVTVGAPGLSNTLKQILPGYYADSKTCSPGGRCTVVSVTGYSSTCGKKDDPGTLKRELLLEF